MVLPLRFIVGSLLLPILASVVASLVIVWLLSQALGFHFDASLVAVLSTVLAAAMIAPRLRRYRGP